MQHAGFSSCGSRASLLRGMWDLPGPGLEPMSPALAGGFSSAAPPGKPRNALLLIATVITHLPVRVGLTLEGTPRVGFLLLCLLGTVAVPCTPLDTGAPRGCIFPRCVVWGRGCGGTDRGRAGAARGAGVLGQPGASCGPVGVSQAGVCKSGVTKLMFTYCLPLSDQVAHKGGGGP